MKVLCIPYTHTLSHISRPLLVAGELRKRGHDVVFAGESTKTEFIRQEGFDVVSLHEPDPGVLFGNIRAGRLRFVSDAELERMIEADIELYRKTMPDLVLTDGRFSAPLSTHIAGLRHAAIVNVSSTGYRVLPYVPFFEWIPPWLVTRDSRLWRTLAAVNLRIEMLAFDTVVDIFIKLSKRYGLEKPVTATSCLTGKDVTLLADIPEYFPAKDLPQNYHYVGPLSWKSPPAPPPWWPPEKGRKPLLYVTMGTTGISDFFPVICNLVKTSGVTAIITTGAQIKDLQPIDGKLYIEQFIDGDLAMEACDLVVCHGGNGTIYQALQHGKPLIGIPTIPDQKFNMRRVEELRVGRMLSWRDFSRNPSQLLDLVQLLLGDRVFAQNAARFKDLLSTCHAPQSAADIIERSLPPST